MFKRSFTVDFSNVKLRSKKLRRQGGKAIIIHYSSIAAHMSSYRVVDLEEEGGGGERQDPEQDLEHEVEAEHEVEDLQPLVLAVAQGEVHRHHHLMEIYLCKIVPQID